MISHTLKSLVGGALVTLSLAGFASAQDEKSAQVVHFWTSGGESAAIKVYADEFEKRGGKWVDNAIAGGDNARTAAINMIVGGQAPAAVLFNTGKQFDELVEQGLLTSLESIASEQNWKTALPQTFVDSITRNDEIFAIPVNIHGENWFFYNTSVFEKAGVPAPKNWDEFWAAADKLKAAGVIPVALGGQPWQERIMFNAVLLSVGGKDLYMRIYDQRDQEAVKSDEYRKVLETFRKLKQYVDPAHPGRNWNDATAMVIKGEAAVQFMGDWAKGEFINAGKELGKDFNCAIMEREANPAFLMGGDVFVFPKQKDDGLTEGQKILASLMLEPEILVNFNINKGSIPTRTDADVSKMDQCAQTGAEIMKNADAQVPGPNVIMTTDMNGGMEDAITEFWNDDSITVDQMIEKVVEVQEQAN